jgi:hypothetical protein
MAMLVALVPENLSPNRIQAIASHVVNLTARREFPVQRKEDFLDNILGHFWGTRCPAGIANEARSPAVEQFVDQPRCLVPLLGGLVQKSLSFTYCCTAKIDFPHTPRRSI